jgi:hypothetical protein
MARPTQIHLTINKTIQNQYNDPNASVLLQIRLGDYLDDTMDYGGNDVVSLRIIAVANSHEGFVYSIKVRFSYPNVSLLDIHDDFDWIYEYNVKVNDIYDPWVGEPYVTAMGVNQPTNASLTFWTWWVFLDEYSVQKLTVTAEVSYFNGESYQKCVMPISIEVS